VGFDTFLKNRFHFRRLAVRKCFFGLKLVWFSRSRLFIYVQRDNFLAFLRYLIICVCFICQFSKIYLILRKLLESSSDFLRESSTIFCDFLCCLEAFILDILDGLIKKIFNSFIFSDFSFLIRILDDKQIDYCLHAFLISV